MSTRLEAATGTAGGGGRCGAGGHGRRLDGAAAEHDTAGEDGRLPAVVRRDLLLGRVDEHPSLARALAAALARHAVRGLAVRIGCGRGRERGGRGDGGERAAGRGGLVGQEGEGGRGGGGRTRGRARVAERGACGCGGGEGRGGRGELGRVGDDDLRRDGGELLEDGGEPGRGAHLVCEHGEQRVVLLAVGLQEALRQRLRLLGCLLREADGLRRLELELLELELEAEGGLADLELALLCLEAAHLRLGLLLALELVAPHGHEAQCACNADAYAPGVDEHVHLAGRGGAEEGLRPDGPLDACSGARGVHGARGRAVGGEGEAAAARATEGLGGAPGGEEGGGEGRLEGGLERGEGAGGVLACEGERAGEEGDGVGEGDGEAGRGECRHDGGGGRRSRVESRRRRRISRCVCAAYINDRPAMRWKGF